MTRRARCSAPTTHGVSSTSPRPTPSSGCSPTGRSAATPATLTSTSSTRSTEANAVMIPTTYSLLAPSLARRAAATLACAAILSAPALSGRTVAHAANERVSIWLTSTDDAAGRHVTRGLQPQTAIAFAAGTAGGGQTIVV